MGVSKSVWQSEGFKVAMVYPPPPPPTLRGMAVLEVDIAIHAVTVATSTQGHVHLRAIGHHIGGDSLSPQTFQATSIVERISKMTYRYQRDLMCGP